MQHIGLSPSGVAAYKADSLMALIQDAWTETLKLKEKTDEERVPFFTGRFKSFMDVFAAYLGDSDYFFGSDKITSADLVFGIFALFIQRMLNTRYDEYFAKPYPKLDALAKKVLANENVAKFIASDSKSKFGPSYFEAKGDAAAAAASES